MAIPGVDLVIGTQDRATLLEYVEQYQREAATDQCGEKHHENAGVRGVGCSRLFRPDEGVPENPGRLQQFLHLLHHSVGPRAFPSRKPENVLKQARQLVAAGYRESC